MTCALLIQGFGFARKVRTDHDNSHENSKHMVKNDGFNDFKKFRLVIKATTITMLVTFKSFFMLHSRCPMSWSDRFTEIYWALGTVQRWCPTSPSACSAPCCSGKCKGIPPRSSDGTPLWRSASAIEHFGVATYCPTIVCICTVSIHMYVYEYMYVYIYTYHIYIYTLW